MAKQYLNRRFTRIDADTEIIICVDQCPSAVKKTENRTDTDVNKTILLKLNQTTELKSESTPTNQFNPNGYTSVDPVR